MGAACADVTIRNPAGPGRSWTGPLLVDTGAYDSLVPKAHLESIGLEPRGVREYSADDHRQKGPLKRLRVHAHR